jgi:hypothetical protein
MVPDHSAPGTAGLTMLAGTGEQIAVRRLSPPRFRCRPGELPRWVTLSLDLGEQDALRERAQRAGTSVDVLLAVLLEFSLALEALQSALGAVASRRALQSAVEQTPVRVAPLGEWRAWQAALARPREAPRDELPEVVISERLLARCDGQIDVHIALGHGADWPLAKACELTATGSGQTLETFALNAGLLAAARAGD